MPVLPQNSPAAGPHDSEVFFRIRTGAVIGLSLAFFFFHMYTALTGPLSATLQRAVHWFLAGSLLFLLAAPRSSGRAARYGGAWDVVCAAALAAASLYLVVRWGDMFFRVTPPDVTEVLFGGILILVTLEAARRSSGLFLPLTASAFFLYAMLGPYMPGILKHKGYSLDRIISYLYSTTAGVYGIPLGVSATYIVLFVFFGAFLNAAGAGRLLLECSLALTGRFAGGAAKTAVIASALMGTMSGSPIANAVTTGTITIPLMRQSGFDKDKACAVEAVASTGGMIMPPVMGAAAFIMAEYLHVEYVVLMKAAFLPALVFFASLYFTIDFYAHKHRIGGAENKQSRTARTFATTWHLMIPVVCLIWFLLRRYSPMTAIIWSLLILIGVSWLRKETRLTPLRCFTAIMEGAKNAVSVAAACAASGIILGVIGLTGVASSLSSAIFTSFSDFLPGALLAAMCISLLLGMGMPATAVYLILATLVAPSLVQLDVMPIAAHMFVFYFGIISTITPPVALTAYAAAAVGGGDGVRVGFRAFVLGLAAYAIPFVFVYAPEILFTGTIPAALLRFAICIAAVYAVALAIVGFLGTQLSPVCRILAGTAGLFLITPHLAADLAGLLLLLLTLSMHRLRKNANPDTS